MNKEKLLEYYNNEIHTYKERIEEFNKEISVLVEVISNSQSMIERINGGQFDE
ncbi:hypothetical protein [Spiroplasma ixodetis]|uniref:hypothetical protein n=1 Tax=Spiroplasma ixodetis TaxID=2141 RepID=UPI001AEEAB94|nr:hypothetical protein [Spiroplasma ixodetis]WJG69656.1 hypothetical protein SIXOD_v1c05700 [Spiroplasma ixodetis Y32]WJG70979.1 hypothetical protein SIXOD_v1c22810 [Spiroplasma ixodetis Y32]